MAKVGKKNRTFFAWMKLLSVIVLVFSCINLLYSQETRLLRQPTISADHVVFAYGGDLWISDFDSKGVKRLTSTPAVESDPHFSPDGKMIAFTSNRSGVNAVYVLPIEGGMPKRLTWYPESCKTVGWTPDGKRILYASSRETAPVPYDLLWTVSKDGGPSTKLSPQWGTNGSFSPNGDKIVAEKISRWDVEWRAYRGGQNTPLYILDLKSFEETLIPNQRTTDIHPVWMGDMIYFLSDRDWVMNIWSYSTQSGEAKQVTEFSGSDIKWLKKGGGKLVFERDGFIHLMDPQTGDISQLHITVAGDFPWMETKWEDVSGSVQAVSLSPTGKRALMEARGEIFTVPVEYGDSRNLTKSSGAADRSPIWSPQGNQIAWFSDNGNKGYRLFIADQDGLSKPKVINIGESKLGWAPVWSPDGKYIAFADDDVRIKVIEVESGGITTADVGGNNLERGRNGLAWSPDSKWLAYAKTGDNNFRQIKVWSVDEKKVRSLTDPFADSFSPAWDRDGKHLYLLASTDVALGSGWANTSSMKADPTYASYIINLRADDESPFKLRSDEEKEAAEKDEKKAASEEKKKEEVEKKEIEAVRIDFDGIERRIMALPIPVRNYRLTISGPQGAVFIGESIPNNPGMLLHKFSLEKRNAEEFIKSVRRVSVSADGKKILYQQGESWLVAGTDSPVRDSGKKLDIRLTMKLDRLAEWNQIFEEAWRYEKDYFYDPNMHGRDWDEVYRRYAPLVPYIRHPNDLTYVLDQMNGELSVGHSFVYGGDLPDVESSKVGLLGANLAVENGRWKIERIFTTESWNPNLSSPLDKPGIKIKEGYYIVGIEGNELTADEDPYQRFDGTIGRQTIIHINDKPEFAGAWEVVVEPIGSEYGLRQRAWVEDNRRLVDQLSNGKLAYVWVPNTSGPGFVSFNRYFFAQQDKEGAVIDERFNGGGLLDDYMVDLMTRSLRAGLTNEVPNGRSFRLPAGILGPKVLLINELAGSGGDFFPWVFRQQKAGPLIGKRTWGGLVKSSVHYAFVDGSAMTAPDNAVFDPINQKWIAENEGVPADIEVRLDAKSLSEGRDVQLERAVKETLMLLEKQGKIEVKRPPFSTPAKKKLK